MAEPTLPAIGTDDARLLRELCDLPAVADHWQRAYREAFARIMAQEIQRDATRA